MSDYDVKAFFFTRIVKISMECYVTLRLNDGSTYDKLEHIFEKRLVYHKRYKN